MIEFEVKKRMTSAIFETGGKQYKVKEGDEIFIEKLGLDDDEKVKFDNVLAIFNEDDNKIGSPYLKGASVTAKVIKSGKARKIIVYKMHAKKGYRRKQGQTTLYQGDDRQDFTQGRKDRGKQGE